MFLKLTMPSVDRLMKGGVVVKWHKAEGDQVDYGDDLVDVKIELAMSVLDRGSPEQGIRLLKDGGSVRDADLAEFTNERGLILIGRVTASDVGVLRRIEIKEGAYGEMGSLLAILSTEENEPMNSLDEDFEKASEFRVVTNLVG